MDKAKIQHAISIGAGVDRVFEAITTKSGLSGWNTANVEGDGKVGSEWTLHYSGRPEFVWRVDKSGDRTVSWTCMRGPGDSVGTVAQYVLEPLPDGRTRVSFTHDGWPGTHGNFIKCNTLWGGLLHHLKDFVESGQATPAHS